MSDAYTISTPDRGELGATADFWELDPSGALLFWEKPIDHPRSLVIAYAPGAWRWFFKDES